MSDDIKTLGDGLRDRLMAFHSDVVSAQLSGLDSYPADAARTFIESLHGCYPALMDEIEAERDKLKAFCDEFIWVEGSDDGQLWAAEMQRKVDDRDKRIAALREALEAIQDPENKGQGYSWDIAKKALDADHE